MGRRRNNQGFGTRIAIDKNEIPKSLNSNSEIEGNTRRGPMLLHQYRTGGWTAMIVSIGGIVRIAMNVAARGGEQKERLSLYESVERSSDF